MTCTNMWNRIINDVAVQWMFQCWIGMFISYLSVNIAISVLKSDRRATRIIGWILYYQTNVLLARIAIIILNQR